MTARTDQQRPRVGLLCLSAIADDPRVRRQGDLLHAAGYEVVAVGIGGARSTAPEWPCLAVGEDEPSDGPRHAPAGDMSSASAHGHMTAVSARPPQSEATIPIQAERSGSVLRRLALESAPLRAVVAASRSLAASVRHSRAVTRIHRVGGLARTLVNGNHGATVYWSLNSRFAELHALAARQRVDFWLANDWTTLPIAMRLQKDTGTPFGYDTHELAVDEYAQDWKWRLTQRPIIAGIERMGIAHASFVTCVSEGIADRLHGLYRLPVRPTVIRNMPGYSESPFRPTGERIGVLYHGVVSPGRALEESIASVQNWRPEFALTIRGPSDPAYLESLRAIARDHGVEERVTFAPPVAMIDLVREARPFDIGLFAIRGHSEQNRHVLPNKVFEYCMAGLALCVSDLPEIRALVDRLTLGRTIASPTPALIAEAVNALDRDAIDLFKTNALIAARELCWERESGKLLDLLRPHVNAGR